MTFSILACLVIGRSCERSIIALRSANPPCRALRPKNRSPASALRSWHAAPSGLPLAPRLRAEHPSRPVEKLRLPLGDLVGMNVELLCQLGQRLVASNGGQSHLRLESRCVVPARSFGHRLV